MPRLPRTATGQFPAGVSGNPNGRPRRDATPTPQTALTHTPVATARRRDGWINSQSGHGTHRDRRRLTQYGVDIVTDIEAQQLWRSEFLAAAIIEQGPREAFSRGWHLKCEDKELAEGISEDARRIGATRAVVDAAMYENALGGAAIFPVLSGSLGDLSEPLDERGIASVDALHVLEPQELTPVQWYSDIRQPKFRKPMTYRLIPLSVGRAGFVSTVEIHESRLIILPGTQVSVQTQAGQRLGWGDSQLCRPWSVISDFGLAWGSAATLLHNHGKETLEMDGFANIMAQSDGVQEFDRYLDAMWNAWSTLRMNVIDGKSKISRATGTLAGVSDLLNEFKVLMAAAARRPVSVLMGQSQSGLRTGDDDTRTWYKTVESDRADRWHHPLERILQLLLLATAGPTGGKLPELWSIEYPPLWAPTEKEVAETRKTDADRAGVLIDKGVVSADDVAESFYKGDTYSGDIHVNWERREAQAKIAAQGASDLSPEDQAAMGRDGEEQEDLSKEELAELDKLREEFGTEEGGESKEGEPDDEEDLDDLEEEPEEEPEEDDDDREDSAWREDQVGVSASGHGYNPYRSKDGKFGAGAHKQKPKASERHTAAAAAAAERAGKAKGRIFHHAVKLEQAQQAHQAGLLQARQAIRKAHEADDLARLKPTTKNIKAAQVATNKAIAAASKANKHQAAIAKHTEAHAKAALAHAKAVETHTKAKERLAKAQAKEQAAEAKAKKAQSSEAPKSSGSDLSGKPATKTTTTKPGDVNGQKTAGNKPEPKALSESQYNKLALHAETRVDDGNRSGLTFYSSNEYSIINNALRGRSMEGYTDNHYNAIRQVDIALNKVRAQHDMLVYRGVANKSLVAGLKPGDVFHDKAFVSTTSSHSVAYDGFAGGAGGAVFHITVPKGSRAYPMGTVSKYPDEREILLPRGSRLQVSKIEHVDGIIRVHATAITDKE